MTEYDSLRDQFAAGLDGLPEEDLPDELKAVNLEWDEWEKSPFNGHWIWKKEVVTGDDKFEYLPIDSVTNKNVLAYYKNNNADTFKLENLKRVKPRPTSDSDGSGDGGTDGGPDDSSGPSTADYLTTQFNKWLSDNGFGPRDGLAGLGFMSGNPLMRTLSEQQVASYMVKNAFFKNNEKGEKFVDKVASLSMLDTLSGNRGSQFIFGTLKAALMGGDAMFRLGLGTVSNVGNFLLSVSPSGLLREAVRYNTTPSFRGDFQSTVSPGSWQEADAEEWNNLNWTQRITNTLKLLNRRVAGVLEASTVSHFEHFGGTVLYSSHLHTQRTTNKGR